MSSCAEESLDDGSIELAAAVGCIDTKDGTELGIARDSGQID